ncbi:PEP-CTERM sorting domain-containing protein [Roseibacillus persicicus]|uniref:Ice-binding protein C-terminal domain-containing protein n=1 Tax=Roseibacillus persicicus TaxID=454148 RepID=A0A918TNE0_9BACT|nr:PEP-CTERM sorting domain-containing protein [Roseibacillus persicicus]GHC55818.1 hypothetical protein GCM10007100_23300 [Roseibacillus persicicus]
MKISLLAFAIFGSSVLSGFAASITFDNISFGGGNSVLLFDNSGAPLASGAISLYSGVAPTSFDEALTLSATAPLDRLVLDGSTALPGGLISGSFDTPNAGELTGVNLFVLISDESGTQFGAYDLVGTFTKADTPPPASAFTETFNNSSLVTLAAPESGNVQGDFSAIAGPGATDGAYGLRLAAIPEPSSALLAGLALVGGLVRRRR